MKRQLDYINVMTKSHHRNHVMDACPFLDSSPVRRKAYTKIHEARK